MQYDGEGQSPVDGLKLKGGLLPPKNLGRVMDGVYRSAFPQPENLPYLKTLGLKTILYESCSLYPEDRR